MAEIKFTIEYNDDDVKPTALELQMMSAIVDTYFLAACQAGYARGGANDEVEAIAARLTREWFPTRFPQFKLIG